MARGDSGRRFAAPPDPSEARSLDDLVLGLRLLKTWAGGPSYEAITRRVNAAWRAAGLPEREWTAAKNTVAACFTLGRRRVSDDLLLGIVEVLNPDPAYLAQWRQALRIVRGEAEAAAFVQAAGRLPDDIAEFTGRTPELARLAEHLDAAAAGTVVISAIEGMAGVGKTQLAVHVGHRLLRAHGVDRVLYVNLRGFHDNPAQPPADAAAVLDSFLRLLGVAGHDIPHDLPGRTRLYRQRLRAYRALVVLDNAAGTEQVRPLLPDSTTCRTMITSRRALPDLPGVQHLALGVFSHEEAMAFLRRTVGADRIDADPAAAAEITSALGCLPLALRITAARVRDPAKAGWSLADHLARLTRRRAELKVEDRVQLALDLSYQDLPTAGQRLVRLLALHPGQAFGAHAAAALAGTDLTTTRHGLGRLLDDHVLQRRHPDRYEFHDLVRTYAAGQAANDESPTACRAAMARLAGFYLHAASVAMDLAYPHERHRRPRVPPPATAAVSLADQASARQWLDTELTNLLAIATQPAGTGSGTAGALSATLHRHLLSGGHYRDAQAMHQHVLAAARQHGDRPGQAVTLNNLGVVYQRTGEFQRAVDHHRRALVLIQDLGDRPGQAQTLSNLGLAYERMGRYEQATGHLHQALALYRELGDRYGQADVLVNLGVVDGRRGRYQRARDHFSQVLTVYRDLGDRVGQARVLNNLGVVYQRLGQYQLAAEHHEDALTVSRELGARDGEAVTLANLGIVYERLGRYRLAGDYLRQALAVSSDLGARDTQAEALNNLGIVFQRQGQYELAAEHHQQALTIFRGLGDPQGQAEALNGLGETARATGDPSMAITTHTEAHRHAGDIGDRNERARANAGLGHAYRDLGDPHQAREHWQRALALYEELGAPEADGIRTLLDMPTGGIAERDGL